MSFITLSGASLTNELKSIKEILGEPDIAYNPEEEEEHRMDDNYSLTYLLGDRKLRIEYDAEEKISGIWLSENGQ